MNKVDNPSDNRKAPISNVDFRHPPISIHFKITLKSIYQD
jgi:hypothetical protein